MSANNAKDRIDTARGRFERVVDVAAAFDRRSHNPAQNYGIHGVEMRFVLKGEKGAVQFLIFTNWHLPHVEEEHRRLVQRKAIQHEPVSIWLESLYRPIAADIGYHSPEPRYEGQEPMEDCSYVSGGHCYYDGSSLAAQRFYDVMLREGGDGLWRELEAYYLAVFETEPENPDPHIAEGNREARGATPGSQKEGVE